MRPTNLFRALAAIAVLSAPLAAQARAARRAEVARSNARAGCSLSLGLGGASTGVSCAGCPTDRQNGASGFLRVGKGMSRSVMAGLELNGWNKTENGVDGRGTMLSAIAQWYPSMTNGFFTNVGAGMGRLESKTPTDKLQSTGFASRRGLGYDMSIARRWS